MMKGNIRFFIKELARTRELFRKEAETKGLSDSLRTRAELRANACTRLITRLETVLLLGKQYELSLAEKEEMKDLISYTKDRPRRI